MLYQLLSRKVVHEIKSNLKLKKRQSKLVKNKIAV